MAKHHVSVVGMDDYNNKAIGTGFMMVEWANDHVKLLESQLLGRQTSYRNARF